MRVLLVEDLPALRRLVAQILQVEGHNVTGVATADEAIRALHRGDFDVLITDVKLDHPNGCQLALNVMRAMPTMRVLLLSGYALADVLAEHPECRGMALLQKPFTAAELRAQLAAMGLSA